MLCITLTTRFCRLRGVNPQDPTQRRLTGKPSTTEGTNTPELRSRHSAASLLRSCSLLVVAVCWIFAVVTSFWQRSKIKTCAARHYINMPCATCALCIMRVALSSAARSLSTSLMPLAAPPNPNLEPVIRKKSVTDRLGAPFCNAALGFRASLDKCLMKRSYARFHKVERRILGGPKP